MSAENLDNKDDGPNNNESWILKDTFEDVNFVIDLSGANHVEDLHEDEQIEDNGQMTRWSHIFKRLVNWSLLSVLNHTHKNIEFSIIPLFNKGLVVYWIFLFKLLLDHGEINLLSCSSATVFSTNFANIIRIYITELLGNEV